MQLTIQALVSKDLQTVWTCWNSPEHITQWNAASDDWHCPSAETDLRVGGKFRSRMEARDGSFGFDFEGTYIEFQPHTRLAYTMPDGRRVTTQFEPMGTQTQITTTFDAETENPIEMQRDGWQAILNRFQKYAESQNSLHTQHS